MASKSDVELLTEHFGYPPVSLLDDIINSINILAERALNSVEQGLLNAPPASLGFRPPTHIPAKDIDPDNPSSHNGLPIAEDAHRHEIEAGTHQLETLLCASIDRNFDKFEIYVMRNILCVRPDDRDWIRLSHYEGLDFSPAVLAAAAAAAAPEDDTTATPRPTTTATTATVETVNRLRRRLQASQKLNVMLHAERARNAAMLDEVRRLVGTTSTGTGPEIKKEDPSSASPTQQQPSTTTESTTTEQSKPKQPPLAFLHNRGMLTQGVGAAESPITTTAAFTLSQLQALRALSRSLRNLLPDLEDTPSPPSEPEEEEDEEEEEDGEGKSKEKRMGRGKKQQSWRRERLEYVETATRKHLENVRGLELGKHGEVRDGDWEGGDGGIGIGGGGGGGGGGGRVGRGASLGRGEVDGLEGVVAMLGGGKKGGSSKDGDGEGGDRMDET